MKFVFICFEDNSFFVNFLCTENKVIAPELFHFYGYSMIIGVNMNSKYPLMLMLMRINTIFLFISLNQ